jgi:hypothetical protein
MQCTPLQGSELPRSGVRALHAAGCIPLQQHYGNLIAYVDFLPTVARIQLQEERGTGQNRPSMLEAAMQSRPSLAIHVTGTPRIHAHLGRSLLSRRVWSSV